MSPASKPDRLAIWLDMRHVADLQIDRRQNLSLTYTDEAVEIFGLGTLCLSVALPVARTTYRHNLTFPWAEGMLPEGETRTVLERLFRVRRGDTFRLLVTIGRECAGAVSFLDPGENPVYSPERHDPLTSEQLEEAISDLKSRPLGADDDVRVSLGGIQAKLLLTKDGDGRWTRPAPGVPSTHILKPEPFEFPGLVASEAYILRAANYCGFPSANVELSNIGGRDVLIVERFDRKIDAHGRILRIHQEDAGQALSLDPSNGKLKYQSSLDEPPSLSAIAEVLRTHGTDPVRDLLRLLEMTTIHIAVGNTDAHARNHGFIHVAGGVSLSPLYDAAPTREFVTTRTVALWVGDQMVLSEITRDHLVREAVGWGFPQATAERTVRRILDTLPDALQRAAEETPQVRPEIVEATLARTRRLQTR